MIGKLNDPIWKPNVCKKNYKECIVFRTVQLYYLTNPISHYNDRWPVTGEFPAQKASNAENVSIWWRHHETNILNAPCCNRKHIYVTTCCIVGYVPVSWWHLWTGLLKVFDCIRNNSSNHSASANVYLVSSHYVKQCVSMSPVLNWCVTIVTRLTQVVILYGTKSYQTIPLTKVCLSSTSYCE